MSDAFELQRVLSVPPATKKDAGFCLTAGAVYGERVLCGCDDGALRIYGAEGVGDDSGRELRLLELARALAGKPRLLLLDEPLAGLGSTETQEMIALIRSLPSRGVTVVIIEHTMHAMVSTVDRFVVLDHGALLTSGSPMEVTRDPRVIEAYLGRKWAGINAAA
jgi:ABC-type sugar transport system ATPase subunit